MNNQMSVSVQNQPTKCFRPCFDDHPSFSLSIIIIICKIIILVGLLITFFSNHWAINPLIPNIYAGKSN